LAFGALQLRSSPATTWSSSSAEQLAGDDLVEQLGRANVEVKDHIQNESGSQKITYRSSSSAEQLAGDDLVEQLGRAERRPGLVSAARPGRALVMTTRPSATSCRRCALSPAIPGRRRRLQIR